MLFIIKTDKANKFGQAANKLLFEVAWKMYEFLLSLLPDHEHSPQVAANWLFNI